MQSERGWGQKPRNAKNAARRGWERSGGREGYDSSPALSAQSRESDFRLLTSKTVKV